MTTSEDRETIRQNSIRFHLFCIEQNPGDGAERRIRIDSQKALRRLARENAYDSGERSRR